jgi:cytochrome c5
MPQMTKSSMAASLLAAASLGLGVSWAQPAPTPTADNATHSIVLPTIQTELPPGPKAGRDTVSTVCAFCHSTRYILNQPPFPRHTWVNEVQKMRTTFGAPIADQQVPEIVDYLMSIRGAPEPTTKP